MPVDFHAQKNLSAMFFEQAASCADNPFLWRKVDGVYCSLSWQEAASQVCMIAQGLMGRGIKPGDRVLLVSENRPEWPITELAVLSMGGIVVPAYTTNTADDHAHLLADSGARAAFVSTQRLARTLVKATEQPNDLDFICHIDPLHPVDGSHGGAINLLSLDDLMAAGAVQSVGIPALAGQWSRDSTACLIYTSGTGGKPKGVMLHHGAVLHNCAATVDVLSEMDLGHEVFLSFLPLSHAYEHTAGQFLPIGIGAQIYYAEGIESLGKNMLEARPTIMLATPRLYETMYQRMSRGIQKQGGLKEKLFSQARDLGIRRYHNSADSGGSSGLGIWERVMDRAVDTLVRDKVRGRFGGRLKAMVSGGAPLDPEIGLFFTALGLRILQGYGQTESAPVIAVNRPNGAKMHTVGPVISNTEVKIANDGEILCRGELVMQGYWNNPEATAEALKDDWLHTGDVGEFDVDGHLLITDRKKDIIVNSGGDNIAPQRVEGKLCLEPEIAQAMVYGDKRPGLVALIVPDENWLEDWKRETSEAGGEPDGGPGEEPGDFTALGENDAFRAVIAAAIERVNQDLSKIESVRHFAIADEPFTVENGEMTPTMKVRRHILKTRYGSSLDGLYQ